MEIIRAKTAGFCFGVGRAMKLVDDLILAGKPAVTLGPIIHNRRVVEELERRGVYAVERLADAPQGSVIVIRSHGVGKAVMDEARERGLEIADATCPFVSKIHSIAASEGEKGRLLIIAGDADHPEVKGILGHCSGTAAVVKNCGELVELIQNMELSHKEVSLVAQTTFEASEYEKCKNKIKKECTNIILFDTICNATWARQREALEIASESDLCVVIGDRSSANTERLKRVCGAVCDTVSVESAFELPLERIRRARRIGVTAGASTPAPIIEEVLRKMSEIDRNEEIAFDEEAIEQSFKKIYRNARVKGVVTAVHPSELQIDIGTKHTGIVTADEVSDDSSVRLEELFKPGDELDLVVIKTNDQEGIVQLSKKKFDYIDGMDAVKQAADDGTDIEGKISEAVKGGLVANIRGVRVFIPASQATLHRGDEYEHFVGQKLPIKIIELNGKRAIGSLREQLRGERSEQRKQFWEDIEVGKRYHGTVKSITSYGAFVDLGGVDGMVHVSELSWQRIANPSEVVNVGDEIDVYVKNVDYENKKISLGYKDPSEDPWKKLESEYPVGSVLKVPVVSLTKFGAFARVLPGVDGLIHISEIDNSRVEKAGDKLTVGQEVEVKLIGVDLEKKRVSLSIKALLNDEEGDAKDSDADEE